MVRKTKEEAEKTRQEIIEAARAVFHRDGVGRATMEKIAKEAGVTRGAVYWHFADKAALFFAMREDVFVPLTERTDSFLFSAKFENNPLDAIEASLLEFFRVLEDCPVVCELFEIMILRCEFVGEFAGVQQEVNRPALEFLAKMESFYQRAAEKGVLLPGLDPLAAARDTWAFTSGLLHQRLLGMLAQVGAEERIPEMVATHMALRRSG